MNRADTARLLTLVSGFDNREVTDAAVLAWYSALQDVPYNDAQRYVVEHFTTAATRHDYLQVGHVLDRWESANRRRPDQIEADVRSAKSRGILDPSWPKSDPLPPDVAHELARRRLGEVDTINRINAQSFGLPDKPTNLGQIGRTIPEHD